MGWQLGLTILEVFSNINDSLSPWILLYTQILKKKKKKVNITNIGCDVKLFLALITIILNSIALLITASHHQFIHQLHCFHVGMNSRLLSWFLGEITHHHRLPSVSKIREFFLRFLSLFYILSFFYRASNVIISWGLPTEENSQKTRPQNP